MTLTGSSIERSARSRPRELGLFVSLGDTAIQCASFELEAESYNGVAFSLEDCGGNGCGCEELGACSAVSTGLEPPDAVGQPGLKPRSGLHLGLKPRWATARAAAVVRTTVNVGIDPIPDCFVCVTWL